ncbi:MAG TPA: Maf family protein, partial [Gemmatales bacterium]|nr:Maf family protein [Gemmatales bacterium]
SLSALMTVFVAAALPAAADSLVLAADSTVWHQNRIIGKPVDEADARAILGSLAGTEHQLWSGVCLWRVRDGVQVAWQELSELYFKALSPSELGHLLAARVWEGKAGGYGIESHGDPYLTVRRGTVSNVIGLPMESLQQVLSWFAPGLLPAA